MTVETSVDLVVLWEDEIRTAAKLLLAMRATFDDTSADQAAKSKAAFDALDACGAALASAHRDDGVLLLARKADMLRGAV